MCSCNNINTCNNNYSNYDGYFFSVVNRMLINDYTAYSTVYVKCISYSPVDQQSEGH